MTEKRAGKRNVCRRKKPASRKEVSKMAKKKTSGDIVFHICNYTLFLLFTLVCVYPFYYLIINTISSNELSANGQITLLPRELHLNNYAEVFRLNGLSAAFGISVARTVLGTAGTVMVSAFLGYMFTQKKMWKRKFWYRFLVITMYFNAGIIPMFITMKMLHLLNSFWVYVIPALVQPYNIILVKTYVESIPASMEEAAEIDGAGVLQRFVKVILPLCVPILATIAIFSAVGQWNAFNDTLMYVTDQKLYSLQYLLYTYLNQASSLARMIKSSGIANMTASLATQQTPSSIRMTVSVIVVLPILCIYPFFQRYFVKGIMIGAVKG